MMTLVGEFRCDGCGDNVVVMVSKMRVEHGELHFPCPDCGDRTRRLSRSEQKALARVFDRPGGTQISEREVQAFTRRLRRLDDYLDAEGLCGGG